MSSVPSVSAQEAFGGDSPEQLSVTVLNTEFGNALRRLETLDSLFPAMQSGHLALVGCSEVTPGVRDEVVENILNLDRDYTIITPEGNGSQLDTLWVASPDLNITDNASYPFEGRATARSYGRYKRDAGCHIVTARTPGGSVVQAGTERLSPPIIPIVSKRARHRELRSMAQILDEHMPITDEVDVYVNGGDQNHADGPDTADDTLWKSRGFIPSVDGETTYNVAAAGNMAKAVAKALSFIRPNHSLEFDRLYLRPGPGRLLTHQKILESSGGVAADTIGYQGEVLELSGTDHFAVRSLLTLPRKQ